MVKFVSCYSNQVNIICFCNISFKKNYISLLDWLIIHAFYVHLQNKKGKYEQERFCDRIDNRFIGCL